MIRAAILAFLALAAGAALWVRLAPSDPARWHADPLEAARTGRPNDALLSPSESPLFDLPPRALLTALEEVALAESQTTVLLRDDDRITFIQRSRIMGFPDYISARAVEAESGARLAIWSRARFGYSDMGVNAARIERWLGKLSGEGRAD